MLSKQIWINRVPILLSLLILLGVNLLAFTLWLGSRQEAYDRYRLELSRSQQASEPRGLRGYNVMPAGGGVGDRWVSQLFLTGLFPRTGGTNVALDTTSRTTKIDYFLLQLGAIVPNQTLVTIGFHWQRPASPPSGSFNMGNFTGNGDYQTPCFIATFVPVDGRKECQKVSLSSPPILKPSETGYVDIVAPNRTIWIDTDSYVQLNVWEAPFDPPTPSADLLGAETRPGFDLFTISVFLVEKAEYWIPLTLGTAAIVAGWSWSASSVTDRKVSQQLREIHDIVRRRLRRIR